MRDPSGLSTWMRFVGEVACDFFFLAAWALMAWAVHEWIGKILILNGLPYYISYIFEGLLDVSTLIKLWKLRIADQSRK